MRLTIGKKLNALITVVLSISIIGTVLLSTHFFTSDQENLLRKNVVDTASMLSSRVRAEMRHLADSARVVGAAALEEFAYPQDRLRFLQDSLSSDSKILALSSLKKENDKFEAEWRILNPIEGKSAGLTDDEIKKLENDYPLDFNRAFEGHVDFKTAVLKNGTPIIRMVIPFVQKKDGKFIKILSIEVKQEAITALFSESTSVTSFLTDTDGVVLASSDPKTFSVGKSLAQVGIFQASSKSSGGAKDYIDEHGAQQMAAFQSVGFADLKLFTQVPFSIAQSAEVKVFRRIGLLAGVFLSIAFALGLLFSKNITNPIEALAKAADRVKNGDFSIRLPTRKKSRDEIQAFSTTFNEMVAGLEERDKIRSTFAKFHSEDVAEKVLSGELSLGGERKEAIVFFSDVRGFTAMSEKMDPEALVGVLNRYMTRMVEIILRNQGIVDKYVGDAIMAVWGAPVSHGNDAEHAITACLEMRAALAELNEELLSEGLPTLKIGMGLNCGPLIAGNIGSEERMEYTVIGDTVNTASRIESLTKSFGTDFLISQALLNQVPGKFVVERTYEAKVKGKSEPLVVFKVHGYIRENGKQEIIETPYSKFKAEKSDKVESAPMDGSPDEKKDTAAAKETNSRSSKHHRDYTGSFPPPPNEEMTGSFPPPFRHGNSGILQRPDSDRIHEVNDNIGPSISDLKEEFDSLTEDEVTYDFDRNQIIEEDDQTNSALFARGDASIEVLEDDEEVVADLKDSAKQANVDPEEAARIIEELSAVQTVPTEDLRLPELEEPQSEEDKDEAA